jgi:hypothetical protein
MNKIISRIAISLSLLILSLTTVTSMGQAVFVDIDGLINVVNSPVTNEAIDRSTAQYEIPLSLSLYNTAKLPLTKDIYKIEMTPSAGTISNIVNKNGKITAMLKVDKPTTGKITVSTKATYSQDTCDNIEAAKKEFFTPEELEGLNRIDFSFLNTKLALESPVFLKKEFQASPTQQEYIDQVLIGNEFLEPTYANNVAKFLVDSTVQSTIQMWLDRHFESFAGANLYEFPNLAANVMKANQKIVCYRKLAVQDLTPLSIDLSLKSIAPVAPSISINTPRTGGGNEYLIITSALFGLTLISSLTLKFKKTNKVNK